MNFGIKRIALIVGAVVIFATGVMWGIHMTQSDREASVSESSGRADATSGSPSTAGINARPNKKGSQNTKQPLAADAAQQQIIRNLREAMLLPKETRIRPLLKALEETTKVPLRKDLLETMRGIIDEGELESSQYLLSLMEQREEKASVEFLLEATKHESPDVAERALFALEAVAGTVFKNREEAETWAATWKPDPERAKLFAPASENVEESPNPADLRAPGPRSSTPKKTERDAE